MAYVTYTTEALVCGTWSRNTSDRSYLLFTKEAGMLYADARSVRMEKSRQRYALQDFSLVRVSLIKAKRGWMVGSIVAQKNYYQQAVDKAARGSVVSLFRLLRRFVKGEEIDKGLFSYVKTALEALSVDNAARSFVQIVIQVHILSLLGYVDRKKIPADLEGVKPQELVAHEDAFQHKVIGALYTHAIKVSHL